MKLTKPQTNFPESASKGSEEVAGSAHLETSRRAALKKIGRFTTYMAPVMLGIISQRAVAGS